MPFQIIRNDITKVHADAIVNTANPEVAIGSGVDSAIYKAAGKELLLEARGEVGVLEPGEVGITPAFDLDAKYIIHASGPRWQGGDQGEEQLLKLCYDRALALAAENGCGSIAFPLLATGTYGFPKRLGIEIAVDSFTRFLEDHEMEIFLVVFGENTVRISGELGEEVRSFIDNDYVEAALEEEYSKDSRPGTWHHSEAYHAPILASGTNKAPERKPRGISGFFRKNRVSSRPAKETNAEFLYDKELWRDSDEDLIVDQSLSEVSQDVLPGAHKPDQMMGTGAAMSLEDTLKGMYTDSFEKHLQQLINKKGLKNSEVYAAANISKQYFSKLLKGQVKPSKEKVLALAVGLQLNMDEAVDFLRFAGYALSPVSQTDVIVEYFIRNREYNVMKIDIVLFDYGLDPLSKG